MTFIEQLNRNSVSREEYLKEQKQKQDLVEAERKNEEEKKQHIIDSQLDRKYDEFIKCIKEDCIEAVKRGLYTIENEKKTIYGCICQVYEFVSDYEYGTSEHLHLKNYIATKDEVVKKGIINKIKKETKTVFTYKMYYGDGFPICGSVYNLPFDSFGFNTQTKEDKHYISPIVIGYSWNKEKEALFQEIIKKKFSEIEFISDFHLSSGPTDFINCDAYLSYIFRACYYKIVY